MSKLERKKTLTTILIGMITLMFISILGLEKSAFMLVGILAINLILFIHELGHFLVAKLVKMPVYEFSVGVGPKLYSKVHNEIEYCIRSIPLGGYVVFENINDEEYTEKDLEIYRSISPLKRAMVILAGPVFNFLLAFVIAIGIYVNQGFMTTIVGSLVDNAPAKEYGLQVGDKILSINGKEVSTWDEVVLITSQNEELSYTVNRDGKVETIEVKSILDSESNLYKVGMSPQYKKDFLKSITSGFKTTIYNIKGTAQGYLDIVIDMFKKDDNTNTELVGPIGTIQTISESAKYGLDSLMLMIFAMSISVGIFNLIPLIPNLDGGRLLFVFIEVLRGGKHLSKKTEENILVTGAYVMIGLFLFVTLKDLMGLF